MPFINVNQIKMYYNDVGRGPPVVLVHGAGATNRMWCLQIKDLLEAGYRVITYDVRGHGASDRTEGLYSIRLFSQDLESLLKKLKIEGKVFLCGLSMGGLIAQRFAIDNPEKVCGLILSNTYSKLTYQQIATAVSASVKELKENGISEEYLYMTQKENSSKDWNLVSSMQNASEILFNKDLDKSLFLSVFLDIESENELMKIRAATGAFNSSEGLCLIKNPALIIASENDISTPVGYSDFLHAKIEGSQMYLIKDSNHISCIDSYKEYNIIIIDFMNKINSDLLKGR